MAHDPVAILFRQPFIMYDNIKIILYPDPRLKRISVPITEFDDNLEKLAQKMLELMRLGRGVGLAGPQVGKNIRLFVMNHTGQPDDRIYVNPALSDADGDQTAEEGCLSIPEVNVEVLRAKTVHMKAQDLHGKPIDEVVSDYVARICQHEYDHLNGTLIIDRMSPSERMTYRKTLRELEEKFLAGPDAKPAKKPVIAKIRGM